MLEVTGTIDLQVNGYGGVDFNSDADHLTEAAFHGACLALQRDGVQAILATIVTDHIPVMTERLSRLIRLREANPLARQIIVGVHIEGPFINPAAGYRGAHPVEAIHPADPAEMQQLLDAAGGLTRIVTLAPELDAGFAVTRMLSRQGIVVSAGHCDPDLDTLDAAMDAGLRMWTHLGNGCPMQMHRHDNVIQRALSRAEDLWLCFIADGVHVPFHALRNYITLAGEHAIVVTDAMAAAGMGPGRHRIARWEVDVGEDLAVWAPDKSHLIGSAMTMPQATANLRNHLGLSAEACSQLTRHRPANAIGL